MKKSKYTMSTYRSSVKQRMKYVVSCKKLPASMVAMIKSAGDGSGVDKWSFPCVICQNTYINQAELSRHIMIHTGKVWYKCMECSKCFNAKGTFNNHIKRHRTLSEEKSVDITTGVYLEIKVHKCEPCETSSSQTKIREDDVMKDQALSEFNEENEAAFNEQIKMEISENLISQDIKTECMVNSVEYNLEPPESYVNTNNYIKTEIDIEDIKKEDDLS